MRNEDVVNKFLKKQNASTTNLHSTGDRLMSFSTTIAQYLNTDYDNDVLVGNSNKYSRTTSKHMSYIRRYIDVWTTKNVPRDTYNLMPYV